MIVLESAYFQPASVRRTSKRLALKTEASVAFRARRRHQRAAGGHCPRGRAARPKLAPAIAGRPADRSVSGAAAAACRFRCARRASRVCSARKCRWRMFRGTSSRSGSRVQPAGGPEPGWIVTVPTFRVDVAREADLIEEVGRHYGFDRLPTRFPALDGAAGAARSRASAAIAPFGRRSPRPASPRR